MPFEKFAVGTEWQVDSVFQVIQDLKKEGIQSISSLLFDSSDEIAKRLTGSPHSLIRMSIDISKALKTARPDTAHESPSPQRNKSKRKLEKRTQQDSWNLEQLKSAASLHFLVGTIKQCIWRARYPTLTFNNISEMCNQKKEI